jgi:ABC-type transporter Mla maintaining outer membrane lipid asymmetry permease subunit MlaE
MVGNRDRNAAVTQRLQIGVRAPMVTLTAVCAGLILPMQGASELRRTGTINLVVELVTIGVIRELVPLLTCSRVF